MNIEKLKKSKKGFTLVEIIVVLVIIAILAAIAIPAMTGWIDRANEKTILAEARTALLAAQTLVSENYGSGVTGTPTSAEIDKLADVGGTATIVTVSGVKVEGFTFEKGGVTATYSGGAWTTD